MDASGKVVPCNTVMVDMMFLYLSCVINNLVLIDAPATDTCVQGVLHSRVPLVNCSAFLFRSTNCWTPVRFFIWYPCRTHMATEVHRTGYYCTAGGTNQQWYQDALHQGGQQVDWRQRQGCGGGADHGQQDEWHREDTQQVAADRQQERQCGVATTLLRW